MAFCSADFSHPCGALLFDQAPKEVSWKSWSLPHFFPAFVWESHFAVYYLSLPLLHSVCIWNISLYCLIAFLWLIFIYVSVLLCKRMPCVSRCLRRSEESVLCSGTRLIEGSELPDMGAGSRTHVLCRNCMPSQSLSHLSRPRIVLNLKMM